MGICMMQLEDLTGQDTKDVLAVLVLGPALTIQKEQQPVCKGDLQVTINLFGGRTSDSTCAIVILSSMYMRFYLGADAIMPPVVNDSNDSLAKRHNTSFKDAMEVNLSVVEDNVFPQILKN